MLVLCFIRNQVINLKKWLTGIVLWCGILLTSCGMRGDELQENPSMESEQVIEETIAETNSKLDLSSCIIQVQTDTQLGSGILWEKHESEWIVVTTAHVVEGMQEAEVYLVQEEKFLQAKVTEVNGLDLAFLSVSTSSLDKKTEEKYQSVITTRDSLEEKAGVITTGYNPYGELCEFPGTVIDDWIYVEDFDNYMLLCDCGAEAGMSGGAVVTEEGKLVGLVCGENAKGLLAVLPVGVIKSEYQMFQKN